MNAREKADWLSKANPYKQQYLWDSFREGARLFWSGQPPATRTYLLNSRERAAFWKGYDAAEMAEEPTGLRSVRDVTNVPTTTNAPQGQKESSTMAAATKGRRVVARKGGAAAKATGSTATKAKPAAKKGGTGRTGAVEKINASVAKIAKALREGATMKSQKAEYGVSDDGPIRAALYRGGFDSKGAKHGVEAGSIDATKAAGKKLVVKLRAEGAPWYALAFQTGLTEGDIKKIVAEAGGATGRVYTKTEKAAASGR
jgi:hypothetical protein